MRRWRTALAVLAVSTLGVLALVGWRLAHAPSPSQRAAEAFAAAAVGGSMVAPVPVADEAMVGLRRYGHDLQRHRARTHEVMNELGNYHGHGDGTWIFRLGASAFASEAGISAAVLATEVARFLTAVQTTSPQPCCGAFAATSCTVECPEPSGPRAWDREATVHCVDAGGLRLSFVIVDGVVVQVVPDVFARTALALDLGPDGRPRTHPPKDGP